MKTNVHNDTLGLNFINNLRPITYQWRQYEDVPSELLQGCTKEQYKKTDKVLHGLIAQEVKEALDIEGVDTFGGWKIDETEGGAQGISREMFVTPLIKAIQELSAKMDTMQVEIDTLKG